MTSRNDTHRFSVAPMIDWTDRYCRFFHRQLSSHALLYTEMIVDQAVLNGDRDRLLGYADCEHPVAFQLGGSDPTTMAAAAEVAASWGYVEINMNVGCPSDRVQSGAFGACLMKEPDRVADCLLAIREAAPDKRVTVKCRIGVDDQDPAEVFPAFLETVATTGVDTVIVHARKAWLKGLSPKENRTVPPLDYELVARVAAAKPDLRIIVNGGIADLDDATRHLHSFAGVMLGRAAYERPWLLSDVDRRIFKAQGVDRTRYEVVAAVAEEAARTDVPIWRFARHMLGLYHGVPGAKAWRRTVSEEARQAHATPDWLRSIAEVMPDPITDDRPEAAAR